MMSSLRTRLSVSYIAIALISILLISILVNVFLEGQFRQYIKKNIENQNRQFVSLIAQQYKKDGSWNGFNLADIGMNALEQGLIIKIKGSDGKVIWDAQKHNNGMCQQMMLHMAKNMANRYPNWKGGYIETQYPLTKQDQPIGVVEIGYYGPFYFKDTDLAFINALNQGLAGVTILAIIAALFIARFMAKRLSTPIAKVINTAQQIAGGNLDARSQVKTNIKEINHLISAINNLGETLQQQELLRKRLTGDVAHELRTPLATVQSHLEAMIDGIWKLDVDRLRSCHEEIMRIGRMVKDLEKLAQFEAETLSLHKEEFDLTGLIRQTMLNFEPEFYHKGVTLEFDGEPELFIIADRDKISQVLVNLLSNSLKYTPQSGAVRVELRRISNTAEISVKDNGIGIAAEDLPHIFERFYRVDQSRNRLTGGSGIGLAIVKAVVEAHHGTIRAESRLGSGSSFIVTLPLESAKNSHVGHNFSLI